jgi:hypothetical protein
MNWIQNNKKLATILGITIAGGLGLGVWLFMAWLEFSNARSDWGDMSKKTTDMENSKVYPSAGNVSVFSQKLADYETKFRTLREVLLDPKLQQPIKPLSETDFQAKLKERAKAVDQKAKEAGVTLPKAFALGFEEYSDTLPLSAEAAAELNVHLDVMEKFIMTLIGAKVTSLDDLHRTRLTVEKKKGAAAAPAPVAANAKKGAPVPPAAASDQVLDRYTIKCTFTTDQGPLQAVMNNLSNPTKSPDFLAVRLLRVENEKIDAPTKDEIRNNQNLNAPIEAPAPPKTADAKPGDAKTPAVNVIPQPKPQPPDARAIIGAENLKVFLEVDYIRFRQPPDEKAAAPKR